MRATTFVVLLPMWRLSLYGQQSPAAPVLEELRRQGNEKCYHQRQLCCIPDTDSETDSFNGDHIEVEFEFDSIAHNGLVCCSLLSFPARCASYQKGQSAEAY